MRRLALLVLLAFSLPLGGCLAGNDYPDPPYPQPIQQADDYDISLVTMPADLHPGDVGMYMFSVKKAGAPASGLAPTASYKHLASSAAGEIALSESKSVAGEYDGNRALFTGGDYTITFQFTQAGATASRQFPLTLQVH
jgi:hypothetical protein